MKSGSSRILAALLLLLMVSCAAPGIVIFGLELSGVDVLDSDIINEFQPGLLAGYLLLMFVFSVLFQVLAFTFAYQTKAPVYKLFDKRWLPKENSAEVHITVPGERLEKVAVPSFWATTAWDLISHTIFPVFAVSMCMGGVAALGSVFFDWSLILLGIFVIGVFNLLILPFGYWIKDWLRLHTKFVVFTFKTYYIKVRTPILSLLFGIGTLTKVSDTPIKQMQEIQISADPEEFDPEYKTSWLHDQYISIIAKRKNVRTLFLRSIFEKAEDVLFWIDDGPGLATILNRLKQLSSEVALEQSFIANEALRIKMSENQAENLSGVETSELKQSISNRFKKIPEGSKVYDLFRVTDPGLYDSAGNLIDQKNGDEQVKPTAKVLADISGHRGTR